MGITLNPYLSFRDNARQAMEFYHGIFGGKLDMMTYKEFQASEDPAEANKIMHAQLSADSLTLMAGDTPSREPLTEGNSMSVSLSGNDEATLRRYWQGLSAGAQIVMPLEKALWGDTFGMLKDKFGIQWLVNIAGQQG
jgi:PhnB protein